jgi:hypothetical protein
LHRDITRIVTQPFSGEPGDGVDLDIEELDQPPQ